MTTMRGRQERGVRLGERRLKAPLVFIYNAMDVIVKNRETPPQEEDNDYGAGGLEKLRRERGWWRRPP